MKRDLKREYFEWMLRKVGVTRRSRPSYYILCDELNSIEFEFYIDMDVNRYQDGLDLRFRFGYEEGINHETIINELDDHGCTVLEMMVALAINCEIHIMYDPEYGDRTSVWFSGMISSLGLDKYDDNHYDSDAVYKIVKRFLTRAYKPNGSGGLFTLKNPLKDMRTVEIWYQLNWYLNELIEEESHSGRR